MHLVFNEHFDTPDAKQILFIDHKLLFYDR